MVFGSKFLGDAASIVSVFGERNMPPLEGQLKFPLFGDRTILDVIGRRLSKRPLLSVEAVLQVLADALRWRAFKDDFWEPSSLI
jgi:hypothetical protein